MKKDDPWENMYCSANTHYVAMPKNHFKSVKGLDTTFQVSMGNNSINLGVTMSPRLREFIVNDLYNFNLYQILMHLYKYPADTLDNSTMNVVNNFVNKNMHLYNQYMNLDESSKYSYVYNKQKLFASQHIHNPEVETFINQLNIFKFGGHNTNYPGEFGKVRCSELFSDDIDIIGPGCFLLLPTMLSEDVFGVRSEIPIEYATKKY